MRGLLVVVLMVGSAGAQVLSGGEMGGSVGVVMSGSGSLGAGNLMPRGMGESLTGHPYTLVKKTTHEQTLGDGTKVTQVSEEREMRDSMGRTRIESGPLKDGVFTVRMVHVTDPVERRRVTIFLQGKTAMVLPMMERPTPTEAQRALMAAARERREALAKAHPPAAEDVLAPRTIAGVYAEGRRSTMVVPVGKIGNDRELRTVLDVWVALDLKVMMASRRESPQTGITTMEVTEMQQTEPEASLFQVPPGYAVNERK